MCIVYVSPNQTAPGNYIGYILVILFSIWYAIIYTRGIFGYNFRVRLVRGVEFCLLRWCTMHVEVKTDAFCKITKCILDWECT